MSTLSHVWSCVLSDSAQHQRLWSKAQIPLRRLPPGEVSGEVGVMEFGLAPGRISAAILVPVGLNYNVLLVEFIMP